MTLLLTLLACADPAPVCVGFDQMRVTNPDGLAEDVDLERARHVIDELSAHVGVKGVCVPEVRYTDVGDCLSFGPTCYQGPGRPILVHPGSGDEQALRDVLCEALEAELGLELPFDLFPLWDDPPTVRELCSRFPAELDVVASGAASCDADRSEERVQPEQAAWALEQLFPRWTSRRVSVDLERHALSLSLTRVVRSGPDFYGLESEVGPLVRVDGDTFETVARYEIPMVQGEVPFPWLIPTHNTPLVVDTSLGTRAWAVNPSYDRLEPQALPAIEPGSRVFGAGTGDQFWMVAAAAGDDEPGLYRSDLTTGALTALTGPELLMLEYFSGDEALPIGSAYTTPFDTAVVVGDLAAGTWSAMPSPRDWNLFAPFWLGEPVGARVAAVASRGWKTLAVYDRDGWALDGDPCGGSALDGLLPVRGTNEGWLVEEGVAGTLLTRITVVE